MRYIYVSKPGGKPLNIGINNAKRIARSVDKRDQLIVAHEARPRPAARARAPPGAG